MREADFIIVGAGAAGSVLAARLSEDRDVSVILLEAGGRARGPLFSIPLMTGVLLRSTIANWSYATAPEAELGGRRLRWPRGKGLGGSTAINGMVYMRGLPSDFDRWAQAGLPGWDWASVLPAFRRSEDNASSDPEWHGQDGPMRVSRRPLSHPLFQAFLDGALHAGHPRTDDFNGATPDGAGPYDFTIAAGRRVSTARAFLDPARERSNLAVRTRAFVTRVTIENGRATGVMLLENGRETLLRARREVILCGGTVNSPQLLMLSGIGPAGHLRAHGIAVQADLPGVGRNLQDHLLIRVMHATDRRDTIDRLRRIDLAALAGLQAWVFGTGPAASFPIEVGGLFRSHPDLDLPDLQASFMPGLSSATIRLPFAGMSRSADPGTGFFANIFQMRPASRGEITLASSDPRQPPRIQPRYLSAAPDRIVLREGVRRLREIFATAPFDACRGAELAPGAHLQSDSELDQFISSTAESVYHPVGTCRMGVDRDDGAVVDPCLRVRDIAGLRVVDASVMPTITSSNTAAPTIMIAERAADLISLQT
ncbi:MAG: GMC family oxidoreductase [Alsobacter sp.]